MKRNLSANKKRIKLCLILEMQFSKKQNIPSFVRLLRLTIVFLMIILQKMFIDK